jgi:hypothetical protein
MGRRHAGTGEAGFSRRYHTTYGLLDQEGDGDYHAPKSHTEDPGR